MNLLKFSTGNAKLGKRLIFSLPAGHTCRNAGLCRTLANKQTGKITDAPKDDKATGLEFRCFAAMAEAMSPQARKARWHNYDTIKFVDKIATEPVSAIATVIKESILWQLTEDGKEKPPRA